MNFAAPEIVRLSALNVEHVSFMRLSDERARWLAYALALAKDAYLDGYRDGRLGEQHAADRVWAGRRPRSALVGPSLDELEQRRWGPRGREHFGDPRPGDYPGRSA